MAWLCGCTSSVCGQELPAGTTDTIQNSITSICSWKPALLPVTAASNSPQWEQKVKNSLWQPTQTVNKASCCSAYLRICLGFLIFLVFLKGQRKGNRRKRPSKAPAQCGCQQECDRKAPRPAGSSCASTCCSHGKPDRCKRSCSPSFHPSKDEFHTQHPPRLPLEGFP